MPASLKTGRNTFHPTCWVETATQEVFGFDGINLPQRWDGLGTATESVGIETPATACTAAEGSAGALDAGLYYYYIRYFDDEGIVGSLSPAEDVTIAASKRVSLSAIPIPTDTRVTGRQIFRTTIGQATVAYLVTTLSDVVTTTYTDNEPDATLSDNEYVVVANDDGSLPAEGGSRDMPPNHMSAVVQHQNRMYGGIPVTYNEGHIEVTNASATVTGVNTNFTSAMIGRKLVVVGGTVEYTILSVASATSLTLTAVYAGTTNYFARYAIQTERAERLLVYYSYIGADGPEPEAWSALFSFDVPAYGGDITALIPLGQRMYISKLGYMYSFSQNSDPAIDGFIAPAPSGRGCENQNTWCRADDTLYILDRQGVYAFQGGRPERISDAIQPLFLEVNWAVSKWFRMAYDRESETVRLFLALGNSYLPTHELFYYVRTGSWGINEYSLGVGAANVIQLSGRSRVVLGCEHARVNVMRDCMLDGIALNAPGKTRGTVTSATISTLTDSTALFPSTLADNIVTIVDGAGKFQTRKISSATSTVLTVTEPWLVSLDSTSVYQIGGFQWYWTGPLLRYTARSKETTRKYELIYEPTDTDNAVFIQQKKNHSDEFETWGNRADSGTVFEDNGTRVISGDSALRLDVYRWQHATEEMPDIEDEGYKVYRFDNNTATTGNADRWIQTTMKGSAAESPLTIYSLAIDGVR